MKTIIRRVLVGMRDHPGIPIIVILPVVGFLAGIQRSLFAGIVGFIVFLIIYGIPFLYSSYIMGKESEE